MGSFSVLNNIPAVNGQNQLNVNNVNLARTLNRLASGKRINSGADDAAGLQIADSLRGNVMALNQAIRNANDGISFLQIADGALGQVTNLLHRAVTLAEQAATGTANTTNRDALHNEFDQIRKEITRIMQATNYNGTYHFTDVAGDPQRGNVSVFVGDLSVQGTAGQISVSYGSLGDVTGSAGVSGVGGVSLSGDTGDAAQSALSSIRNALNAVATIRGDIGAGMNRLQAAIEVLQTQSQNTLSAESTVRDANVAEEISNMTRLQILAQTGIAALSQANANSQNVLGLLR